MQGTEGGKKVARVIRTPALAMSLDGTLDLVVLADNGQLYEISELTPNGNWSGWTPIGAPEGGVTVFQGSPVLGIANLIDTLALAVYVTANQRTQRRCMQRLEPALDSAQAQHSPNRHQSFDALHLDAAEIVVLEDVADQTAGACSDNHSVWLRQSLQPRSEIGRLADDVVLDNLTADDNQTCRDPDAGVKLFREL